MKLLFIQDQYNWTHAHYTVPSVNSDWLAYLPQHIVLQPFTTIVLTF